jgi:gluconolactonase
MKGKFRHGQGGNATGGALFALDVSSGKATRLLDNWQGLAFNSPNDVAVSRDGSVYFTDPSCGAQQGFRNPEQLGEYVWRWDLQSRAASVVASGFIIVRPNSLVLAPQWQRALHASHAHAPCKGQACTLPRMHAEQRPA